MAKEDQAQKCTSSGCGGGVSGGLGRSSKKPKQKKVPQRGLGVAQLEKIRIEEQQKREAAVAAAAILPSPCSVSSSKSSFLTLSIPNFHHSNQPSSSIPLPFLSGSPPDFRSPLSLQHKDGKVSSTVPLANSGGFEVGWPAVSVPGHENVPKSWSSHELNFEKESSVVDPGLAFVSSLPYESNTIWSVPNCVQRTPQYHQPPSSMVNVSSGTSSTIVPYFLIEPPSNQNNSSSGVPMRPEEKMIGMKRPYPFSLDDSPVLAFNFKLPTFAATRTEATTSCGSGNGFNFDAGSSSFSREVPSCSASNSASNSKKSNKENDICNGDFLTLAPPTPTSCPPSEFMSSSTFLALHNQECPDLESLSCQGIVEDQIPPPPGYSRYNKMQQPLYTFFPPAAKKAQIGQTTARIQTCNEVGESVDLNLKL